MESAGVVANLGRSTLPEWTSRPVATLCAVGEVTSASISIDLHVGEPRRIRRANVLNRPLRPCADGEMVRQPEKSFFTHQSPVGVVIRPKGESLSA